MIKVLIVDDEPVIREGLKSLIDWKSLGFLVADTAANAREALEQHRIHSPDLMIVDIRMPGMDGLQLIQELRKSDPGLHVVVLSGYADFNYAQKAIGLGIDGYLLKPVDEDELVDYLVKLKRSCDRENELQQRSSPTGDWNREMLLHAIFTGSFVDREEALKEAAVRTGMLWKSYQIVLIRLQSPDDELSGSSKTAAARSALAARFDGTGWGLVFAAEPDIGLLLKESIRNVAFRRLVYQEISKVSEETGLAFKAAAGDPVGRLRDIPAAHASALERMRHHFFYEEEMIIGPHSLLLQPSVSDSRPDAEQAVEEAADKLYYALDTGSAEALEPLVKESGKQMLQAGFSEGAVKAHFVQMITRSLTKLSRHHDIIAARMQDFSVRMHALYKQASFPALERYVIGFLCGVIDALGHEGTDFQIKKMIDLIHRNYHENLKLEQLAEVFNYNSAYLGKLFKNTTGEYFNTYLDKVRIEKAKDLLDQGMKVYQVAEKVGFANVDYFHGKFRKYVGTSPSGYRKK